MQKPKRKIGQQNFWQRFYDKYIFVQRDFRYEIDRAPRKIITRLKKYWQKQWYPYGNLILKEEKEQELWSFDLTLPNNFSKVDGGIYLEDGITIIEGRIRFRPFILFPLFAATLLTMLLITFVWLGRYEAIGCSIVPLAGYLLAYFEYKASTEKIKEIRNFWELLVEREDAIVEEEWERLYGKTKNEEENEILKEKRK